MLEINFHPFPELKTARLVLRKVTLADAHDIFKQRSDEAVMKYIPRPIAKTIEEVEKLIGVFEEGIKNNASVVWGISVGGSDRIAGTILLWNINQENQRGEIGYMLHPDFWQQGILSEAMEIVLDYGFNTMKLHSIEAIVHPDNIASIKLLEKMSFVKEAHFKENFFYNGQFEDTVIYSLLTPNRK